MTVATRWLVLIVASSALAVIAAIASTGDAWSMVPLLWFLAVIPGLPFVRLVWKDADPVMLWLTAIGLSLAMDVVVAEALLYANAFTPTGVVAILAGVAVLGASIGRLRAPIGASEPAETAGMRVHPS